MSAYSIFTVCTRNYRDASDFSMDSWLATKARRIYVYTDDPTWIAETDRISILPVFSASDSWLINVGRKVQAFRRILDETSCENVVFLDADCYVLSEIGDVFDHDFDFAVSRFSKRGVISSGVWFSRNNRKMKDFADTWLKKQEEFKTAAKYSRANWLTNRHALRSSYSQNAFDRVLRQADRDGACRILKLPYDIYSLKVDHRKMPKGKEGLLLKLRKKPKILHFFSNSYRNGQLKKYVFDTLRRISDADDAPK